MSNISSIYDRLYEIITTNFSTKTELKNPYDLLDNDEINTKNGFAIKWGTISDLDTIQKQVINLDRTITIIFTKKIYTTEQSTTARKAAEKLLMEEEISLINLMSSDFEMRTFAQNVEFSDDEGIQFVFDDKQNYLSLSMNFNVIYTEFISN